MFKKAEGSLSLLRKDGEDSSQDAKRDPERKQTVSQMKNTPHGF